MKRLILPVAVLAIIAILWLVISKREKARISGTVTENFLELECDKIDRFTAESASYTNDLIKQNGKWYLNEEPLRLADQTIVDRILEQTCTLSVGEVFSNNPDMQSEFMLGENRGTEVSFFEGDNLISSVIIGKMNPEMTHTYIRKAGSDNVYIVPPAINYAFNLPRAGWIDKFMVQCPADSVASITLIKGGNNFSLVRTDETDSLGRPRWIVADNPNAAEGDPADPRKISSLLNQACALRGYDLVNAQDSGLVNFADMSLIMVVRTLDGNSTTVEFAAVPPVENSNRFYARLPEGRDTLVVTNLTWANLAKPYQEFVAKK